MSLLILCIFTIVTLMLVIMAFFLVATLWAELSTFGKPSAPFVPLSRDSLSGLVAEIEMNEHSFVYDLGCGDGRVIEALYKKEPRATFVGIERGLWPYVIGRIKTRKIARSSRASASLSLPKFKITLGNIFAQDLSKATHVTTYLFPKLMEALLPKLKSELAPGTLLYSVDFKFATKEPKYVVSLNRPVHSLGRTLFVYEF